MINTTNKRRGALVALASLVNFGMGVPAAAFVACLVDEWARNEPDYLHPHLPPHRLEDSASDRAVT